MKLSKTSAVLALTLAGGAALIPALGAARGMGGMDGMMPGGAGGPGGMMNFEMFDANNDGSVTTEELAAFRTSMITGMDANSDGLLSAEELAADHMAMMEQRAAERAAQMIERHDANADGMLSAEEMAAPPMPVAAFERMDADQDGSVSKAEFDAARAEMIERMGDRGRGHQRGMKGMQAPVE